MNASATIQNPYIELNKDLTSKMLENYLGDPYDPAGLFSFKNSMELDECESYPEELLTVLDQWGLKEYLIPASLGGKLTNFEEVFALMRCVSRRDVTVAIAYGNVFLGSVPIWIAGNPDQKTYIA